MLQKINKIIGHTICWPRKITKFYRIPRATQEYRSNKTIKILYFEITFTQWKIKWHNLIEKMEGLSIIWLLKRTKSDHSMTQQK